MEPYADEPLTDDVSFTNRKTALAQKEKPFVMQFQPALKGLKTNSDDLIQNQPNFSERYSRNLPCSFIEKESRLKVCLSKQNCSGYHGHTAGVVLVCQTHVRHVFSCTTAALSSL